MAETDELSDRVLIHSSLVRVNNVLKENTEQSVPPNKKLLGKSLSMNLPRYISKSNEDIISDDKKPHRWSHIPNDSDQMERLERRLLILGEDASSESIKNMVRKVSHAFTSSFQAYDDSPHSVISSEANVSHDLSLILGTTTKSKTKSSYRRSTGTLGNTNPSPAIIGRSRSELSVFREKRNSDTAKLENFDMPTMNSVEEGSPQLLDIALDNDDINITSESNDPSWSADVDQVFDEVNADLDSIADSIASDTAKSNGSESDSATTYEAPTTIGMDITQRAAFVDQRLREANENFTSPNSVRKINVEVKRVADRIKEYKKLIDAERRMNSRRRGEPKTMNEMIESLDSIKPSTVGSSPVYSSYRRRFKSSRECENENDTSDNTSPTSESRSYTERFEKPRLLYASESFGKTSHVSVLMSSTDLADSASSIAHKDLKTLKDTANISERTENYNKALKNSEEKNGKNPLILIHQKKYDENGRLSMTDAFYKPERPTSAEWHLKALPQPKRTNAIKRRQLSADDASSRVIDKNDVKFTSLPSNYQHNLTIVDPNSTDPTVSKNNNNNKKKSPPVGKKPSRSSSVPPPNINSDVSETVIHEEVSPPKCTHPRLTHRSKSDSSSASSQEDKPRGRSDAVKYNRNSGKYLSLPRRKKNIAPPNKSSPKLSTTHRSTSLPRRARNSVKSTISTRMVDELKSELDDEQSLLRSPSIRCIQLNHVNNRIKDYFTNLQDTSKISSSRPNLVLVGSSGSESDIDESSSDGRNSPTLKEGKTEHILRGTVRSMIKKYGSANYVFD